jgi:CheY-like chemotaxis protein/outer membrane murein-binding lipoprotein Lpp
VIESTATALAASDTVELVKGVVWPVLLVLIGWRLYPTIRNVIESRGFTVKAGGAEITVQQASDQLAVQVDDLRTQVSTLRAQLDSVAPNGDAAAYHSPTDTVSQLRRVLWVDDHPENNAFEIAALRRRGVEIIEAKSTRQAESILNSGQPVDAVITDMGRDEEDGFKPDAGLELIGKVTGPGAGIPAVVYTSANALARTRDSAMGAGATGATSSGTELLDILGRLGAEPTTPQGAAR